jgi:hypothetical protein
MTSTSHVLTVFGRPAAKALPESGRPTAAALIIALLACTAWPLGTVDPLPAWQRGGRLLDAGRIIDGIRVLDSLRRAGFDDPSFLSDYSRRVFRTFVPRHSDSALAFLQSAPAQPSADTACADRISWKVTWLSQCPDPMFQYNATFTCRKPFHLIFPGLGSGTTGNALLAFPQAAAPRPGHAALLDELNDRTDAAACTVCMDLCDTRSPLMEYLGRRIDGRYDSIGMSADLPCYRAVSIRCYRRDFTYGKDGEFAAFVVFDRCLGDLVRPQDSKHCSRADLSRLVRFTVAVRSGMDIKVFTEAKLQTVLRAF